MLRGNPGLENRQNTSLTPLRLTNGQLKFGGLGGGEVNRYGQDNHQALGYPDRQRVDSPCADDPASTQIAGEKGHHAEISAALQPRTQPHREALVADEAPLDGARAPHQRGAGTSCGPYPYQLWCRVQDEVLRWKICAV